MTRPRIWLICSLAVVGFGCSQGVEEKPQSEGSAERPQAASQDDPQPSPKQTEPVQALSEKVQKLLTEARDADPKVRARAIIELSEEAEESRAVAEAAVPVFAELLRSDDPSTRAMAVRRLGEIGDAQGYRTRDLQGTGNPLMASKETLSALVNTLADPVEGVREETPRELGTIAEYNLPAARRIIGDTLPLLNSKDAGTRAAAAEALYHVASRLGRVWDQLRIAPEAEAAQLASQIPPLFAGVTEPLSKLTDDADQETRGEAERALEAVRHFQATAD